MVGWSIDYPVVKSVRGSEDVHELKKAQDVVWILSQGMWMDND